MKVYQSYSLAQQWKNITGVSLRDFVDIFPDGSVIPDVVKIEQWLNCSEDDCIADVLEEKYGQKAVDIINKLLY